MSYANLIEFRTLDGASSSPAPTHFIVTANNAPKWRVAFYDSREIKSIFAPISFLSVKKKASKQNYFF